MSPSFGRRAFGPALLFALWLAAPAEAGMVYSFQFDNGNGVGEKNVNVDLRKGATTTGYTVNVWLYEHYTGSGAQNFLLNSATGEGLGNIGVALRFDPSSSTPNVATFLNAQTTGFDTANGDAVEVLMKGDPRMAATSLGGIYGTKALMGTSPLFGQQVDANTYKVLVGSFDFQVVSTPLRYQVEDTLMADVLFADPNSPAIASYFGDVTIGTGTGDLPLDMTDKFTITVVPEPGSAVYLVGLGVTGLLIAWRYGRGRGAGKKAGASA